ncbi:MULTISPECIES: nickel insertion protein [Methanohalophilus]|jgi:hypothetical protein|uniref:DUF111 family protein n=1 Tax=Methanohalophilus euhalobius TaxID=51203 RepID=A0A285EPB1_9EURY|nr:MULTISPECIES: nickel insertion protein [Methanohalophilus]KXS36768.1 MAG: hypothetical protein AWU58_2164 [Methanohalophilus sp. T328-1]RSD34030.1 MAG: hypothetical protein CI953_1143 [Methanohalophilus sp.]ODV49219.1 MAG: hypothetical protein A8273_1537 [Methanohalophilus sp. 2-GBenrich]PQV43879.1 uncharacterized protein DUF111 [Methanohalophilus euhalobius]RNI11985.1 DUF111 family protein [Methanohalophilus euhalobius]
MKILLFDPFSGAAGDMIIGSLISLGADGNKVKETLESILDYTRQWHITYLSRI